MSSVRLSKYRTVPDIVRCAPGYTSCPVVGKKMRGIFSTANGLTNIATGHSKRKSLSKLKKN